MTNDEFLYIFLAIAAADLYMSMVQRTTQLISRMGDTPQLAGFLNPEFVKFAMPLTLLKWGWVAYWALSGSFANALFALFLSWLAAVLLPVPSDFTLPPVRSQIARVAEADSDLADILTAMTMKWEAFGSRR